MIRTFAIMLLVRDQGVINNILIWAGVIEKPIEMLFTNFAVALGLLYVYLPFMVLPLYASMEKIDFRLIEAGYDLYANRMAGASPCDHAAGQARHHCRLHPGVHPSIGAYVTPRLLGGGKNMMLGNLIANQFGTSRNWPLGSAMALALMAVVMVALDHLCAQRIEGALR